MSVVAVSVNKESDCFFYQQGEWLLFLPTRSLVAFSLNKRMVVLFFPSQKGGMAALFFLKNQKGWFAISSKNWVLVVCLFNPQDGDNVYNAKEEWLCAVVPTTKRVNGCVPFSSEQKG